MEARTTFAGCNVRGRAVRQRSTPPRSSRLWIDVCAGMPNPSGSPATPAGLGMNSATPTDGIGQTNCG